MKLLIKRPSRVMGKLTSVTKQGQTVVTGPIQLGKFINNIWKKSRYFQDKINFWDHDNHAVKK